MSLGSFGCSYMAWTIQTAAAQPVGSYPVQRSRSSPHAAKTGTASSRPTRFIPCCEPPFPCCVEPNRIYQQPPALPRANTAPLLRLGQVLLPFWLTRPGNQYELSEGVA